MIYEKLKDTEKLMGNMCDVQDETRVGRIRNNALLDSKRVVSHVTQIL